MKLHELLGSQYLMEQVHTIPGTVERLEELIDPKTGKYYTGVVNVTGGVHIGDMELTELPVKFGSIGAWFFCTYNGLTSLKGAPSSVGADFSCHDNQLTSLEGAPNVINGAFNCGNNQLTSLEGIHKRVKKLNGVFWCKGNLIKTGGIGIILIDGVTKIVSNQPPLEIINKYLGQGKKGLLLCQNELIEAGYEEFAKL